MNADEFDRWDRHEAEARQRATDALANDVTADELVAVVRTLADELREMPPRVRAVAAATHIADELVAVLVDAGVEFANEENAPTQIAGSLLAGWMAGDRGTTDTVEWLNVAAGCLPDAIAWARWNGDTAEPAACEAIQRLVEGDA